MSSVGAGIIGAVMSGGLKGAGVLAGAGAIFTYGWASDNFAFNRDAWIADAAVIQVHAFQKDNIDIMAHGMAREEIRDRQTSINTQIANLILTVTLLMTMAIDMLVNATLTDRQADFVINAYAICLSSTVLYFTLSICYALVAANVMYHTTLTILTSNLSETWIRLDRRLESYKDVLVERFEQKTILEWVKPPMFRGLYRRSLDTMKHMSTRICGAEGGGAAQQVLTGTPQQSENRPSVGSIGGDSRRSNTSLKEAVESTFHQSATIGEEGYGGAGDAGEGKDRERDRLYQIICTYRKQWADLEKVWQPMRQHARFTSIMGLKAFLDALGYYCLARVYTEQHTAWVQWVVQVLFVYLQVLLLPVLFNFAFGGKFSLITMLLFVGAPASAMTSATTCSVAVDRIAIPSCFICHLYLNLSGILVFGGVKRKLMTATSRRSPPFNRQESDDALTMDFKRQESDDSLPQETTGTEGDGNCDDSEENTQDEDAEEADEQQYEHDVGDDRFHSAGWRLEGEKARRLSEELLFGGRILIVLLWFAASCWVCSISFSGKSFKNAQGIRCEAFDNAQGGVSMIDFSPGWPSPYFHPRALTSGPDYSIIEATSWLQHGVGHMQTRTESRIDLNRTTASHERIFVSDRYRVYELIDGLTFAQEYPCDVNGSIADVAFGCDALDELNGTSSDAARCRLTVLVQGISPTLVDCTTGIVERLLKSPKAPAERLTALSKKTILVTHASEVVRYDWSARRGAWTPAWSLAEHMPGSALPAGPILAVGAVNGKVGIVRSRVAGGATAEIRDLTSGKQCGSWVLPESAATITGGTLAGNGSSLFVLASGTSEEKTLGPMKLLRAELPYDQAQCDDQASKTGIFR